jgi:maltooligosyltrehalose trehalohydrolase
VDPLHAEGNGYFSGLVPHAAVGTAYRFRLDGGSYPDPASRSQPDGPHGPSVVVDATFAWTDHGWRGHEPGAWVMYELHLGTFTPEGTWSAAAAHLPALAALGITVLEVMPIAEFSGGFGWGYDGVDLFAPSHLYGPPADARAFVNRAHELGLMVILDVVYNHLGPDGNYLRPFSPAYFSSRYANEWGEPMNFDGESSGPVREFFITNARYWIEEFRFDGLRFDATQQMFDASPTPVLQEIASVCRAAAGARRLCLVAENECQHARLVRSPAAGGYGLDAIWNDDFHHAAMVAATGRAEAYYSGFRGTAQEFVSCATRGFLYQGQWYPWQRQRRGQPALDLPATATVVFLQNHDQVANSLAGERLAQVTSPAQLRALTALLLLGPNVPMLFQGQEFGASAPFLYFADHRPELAAQVRRGREAFLSQFPSVASPEARPRLAPPEAPDSFRRCQLDWAEASSHGALRQLHVDLLALRRTDPARRGPHTVAGAVLGERAFVLRLVTSAGDDRLLVVNLGPDLAFSPTPEPLLAPPADRSWTTRWSSESPAYGGHGTSPVETRQGWMIPGSCALWMIPDEPQDLPDARLCEKD